MKTKFVLFVVFSATLLAQERVLFHIGANGRQEAFPLKKGEQVQDVIERLEKEKECATCPPISTLSAGLIDTIRYFNESGGNYLRDGFNYHHQEVALQYYVPAASGIVKEVWWRNYTTIGNLQKATIRAWNVNPKVMATTKSAAMGHYKDLADGDGLKTPYKPPSGDQWFYKTGGTDSASYGYDPLGTEAAWLVGGLQVSLKRNQWQGIKLLDVGDTMNFKSGVPFGFTIQNDTKLSDIGSNADSTMSILSASMIEAPYHSLKFYETQRLAPGDGGWWTRTDFEWGMYVVVEYCQDCYWRPRIILSPYETMIKPLPRQICCTIYGYDDNPGGGSSGISSVFLNYRFGTTSQYESVQMFASGNTYCATIPTALPGDTVYYYIVVTDVNGNQAQSPLSRYRIFKKNKPRLFVYNNSQYALSSGNIIYTGGSSSYDHWSSAIDGTLELDTLFSLYDNILICDGSFPARDVYTALKEWIATGTAEAKKNLFFSSQDYGCYIEPNCADTTFAEGSFEYDYLGVEKIGPQDISPTNKPMMITPVVNPRTCYILQYNKDSSTTLWYDPTFELGFSGYADAMTPRSTAKALFKDGSGSATLGIIHLGATFNTMFLGFDAGALQFRSDTSKTPGNDPKYRWINDVAPLSHFFFCSDCTTPDCSQLSVDEENKSPYIFSLIQNYPNPFNPTTTINYEIPSREHVRIVIYNVLGQAVATLVNETKEAGTHTATFNAQSLASGIYFYEMRAGNFVNVKKMVMMK